MAEPKLGAKIDRRKLGQPIEPRFWARVAKGGPDECWEWTGGKDGVGYGRMCIYGRYYGAHRIALWLAGRMTSLDDPGYACHHCDNRGCVNERHIWLGDSRENMTDAYTKGRMAKQIINTLRGDAHPARYDLDLRKRISERQQGEKSHRAKLTEADVRLIFELRIQKLTQQEIADQFAISREEVGLILRRKKWGHLTGLPPIPTRRTQGAWND